MREPLVRLVYERTAPPGTDSGVEPLIAVVATEEEAERLKAVSASRGRDASWEALPLQGPGDRTAPLAPGVVVHLVLLGGGGPDPERDPIGIAVFTDREAAERRALEERCRAGDPGYHAVSLPIGWTAGS